MSKLTEYREKVWIDYISSEESFGVEHDEAFDLGFKSALELDLAIKFLKYAQELETEIGKWNDEETTFETNYEVERGLLLNEADLYKYWIENIFKIK